MTQLDERVAVYCAKTGTTRQGLANELGISAVSLRSKLTGKTEFRLSEAARLSDILGCSIDALREEFVASE